MVAEPYGTWRSPLSAAEVAASGTVAPAQPLRQVRGDGADVYWLESRPRENGRGVVVRRHDGVCDDASPAGVDVGSRVHEYGGGDFAVLAGVLWYVDAVEGAVWRLAPGDEPVRLTAAGSGRHGAPAPSPDGRLLVCVREPENALVVLDAVAPREPRVLPGGLDLHADPAVSPDGRSVAWTTWRETAMPWDESELWLAPLDGSGRAGPVLAEPGASVFQPAWSPDGVLHVVSDRDGWWNLHRLADGGPEPVAPVEADRGVPQWLLGLASYCFLADGRIAVVTARDGFQRLELVDPRSGAVEAPPLPFTAFVPAALAAVGEGVAFVAASPRAAPAVVVLDPASGEAETLRATPAAALDAISEPEPIRFRSFDGEEAHALHYPPAGVGPAAELPPLVVMAHGGPTNAAAAKLDLGVQFWTSRGFAYLDVNYGGSSGYGRRYRERLRGRWGVVDVADCVAAARTLVERGDADPARMVIRGASAGGFTVCHALAGESPFAAGTSYFGVLDLEALVASMHRFEAHYFDWLVGAALLRERSPLRFADRIERPLLLLQGLDDGVVPPAQLEAMVARLRELRRPHAAISFPGEGHGFRRADTIERALAAEHAFYCRVLGLEPGDPPAHVEIENLDEGSIG